MSFALVTGASGGIGWALCRELASRKHDVLLVARSESQLKKNCEELRQSGTKAEYLAMDLSTPDAANRVYQWVQSNNFPVDILINNAGFGVWGPVKSASLDELSSMMNLNMITLAQLCKLMLPNLEKNERGYILNIASTAAYQAVPTLSTYAATKAFVLVFSRGLRFELKKTNISVTCISPGPTSTGFIDRAKMDMIRERAERFTMSSESVAKLAINAMYARKTEVVPGFPNWLTAKLAELSPKGLTELIANNIYKK